MYIFLIHNSSCNLSLYLLWSKKNGLTWTPGLVWRNSFKLRAKVHGGCRLTFEEIAQDVKWRKPSSEENSAVILLGFFYSSCGELDTFQTLFLIRFGKKTVGTVLRHRQKLLWSLICTDIVVSKDFWNMDRKEAAAFQVWNNQESWKFRTCTVKHLYF